MPIFHYDNGMEMKFFIQKDLPDDIQARIRDIVTRLGGRIVTQVPRYGFVLVNPGTLESDRLRLSWSSITRRPGRRFVPYTYVEACETAGKLLWQIFLDPDGHPLQMHIHQSISSLNERNRVFLLIMHSGGNPEAELQYAAIIIADPDTEVFDQLIERYEGVPEGKYVESYLWVQTCVDRNRLEYSSAGDSGSDTMDTGDSASDDSTSHT